jgi:hypothetical protein
VQDDVLKVCTGELCQRFPREDFVRLLPGGTTAGVVARQASAVDEREVRRPCRSVQAAPVRMLCARHANRALRWRPGPLYVIGREPTVFPARVMEQIRERPRRPSLDLAVAQTRPRCQGHRAAINRSCARSPIPAPGARAWPMMRRRQDASGASVSGRSHVAVRFHRCLDIVPAL